MWVYLNAYYRNGYQIIVATVQAGAMFIHGRRGTLYFYKEDVGGFVNAEDEASLSY